MLVYSLTIESLLSKSPVDLIVKDSSNAHTFPSVLIKLNQIKCKACVICIKGLG